MAKYMQVSSPRGQFLDMALQQLQGYAILYDQPVQATFNGIVLVIHKKTDLADIAENYRAQFDWSIDCERN